ncbi:MAG: glycosyltransferase [Chloroflexi bacterium]|nr:glycosyltransferase [Chloroflexota bacterium]
MTRLLEVPIGAHSIDRFLPLLGENQIRDAYNLGQAVSKRLAGRVLWNVNSTASGGGVAEILRSVLPYVRALGIDARWLVINGTPEFFHITKRLHHALHGSAGDGSELGERERAVYERVLKANVEELLRLVQPRDFVILHDPQTAGLAPRLIKAGAIVVWRCHVGGDKSNGEEVERGWDFLAPYIQDVAVNVFSRHQYIPQCCDHGRSMVIPPSINAFSPKNQELDDATVRAILVHTGLVEGPPGDGSPTFLREDGSPGRVERHADILRLGRAPTWDTPLIVQVSRWDPLKDPVGVMHGFTQLVDGAAPIGAELVLAGPNVHAVADDPEAAAVMDEVIAAWHRLSHSDRNRVHLASLPMADIDENAAIVNALQRHAAIVVQKSLHEGFGLTVTEAMWKARPIVASAVGGIQDQITDGVHGLLLDDPTDTEAFAAALRRLLEDRAYAEELGQNARQRVREQYLGIRHLSQYAELLKRVDK